MNERPRHERRHYFRGNMRPGRVLAVRFRIGAEGAWIVAETRNIGVGGAYIATAQAQVVGTPVTVELALPTSAQVFALPAIVRWASQGEHGGMGVQFVGVDVDVLLELNDYFSSLTAVRPA